MADTPQTDKYTQAINASKVGDDDAAVAAAVEKIIDEHFAENNTQDVYKFLFRSEEHTSELQSR